MDRDNRTRTGAKDPWGREARSLAQRYVEESTGSGLRAWSGVGCRSVRRIQANWATFAGMPGAGLTAMRPRKAQSERLALKPYRGNPDVRNFRGGDGIVAQGGTVNPPRNRKGGSGNPPPTGVRAIALPDPSAWLFSYRAVL